MVVIGEIDCYWIHGLHLPVDYRLLVSHLLLFLVFHHLCRDGAIVVDQEIGNTGGMLCTEKIVQDVPVSQTVEGARESPLENAVQGVNLQVTSLDGGVPRAETVVGDMCSEQEVSKWGMEKPGDQMLSDWGFIWINSIWYKFIMSQW